jgi:hypothetical protein
MTPTARDRIRFIGIGAVIGIAWAASLRGFMQQLAGPTSTFSFGGTFGIIIPAGTATGALLGWAEYQRRIGRPYPPLIAAPLLIAIVPTVGTGQLDGGPIGLALGAMVGGYAVSGRGPLWARIVAAVIGFAGHLLRAQALPGPQLHHPARRLVLHPGLVPVRGPRPGLLDPHAPAEPQPQP